MRERGVQSRRVRESKESAQRPAPNPAVTNIWQIIAIIALLAATAGWTTVAVIALRGPDPAALAGPAETTDPDDIDSETEPPEVDEHIDPELEAVLPTEVNGVALETVSVTGNEILADDGYSTTVKAYLTSIGKTQDDLHFARAFDPNEALEAEFHAYRVPGGDGAKMRDTLIEASKVDFPDLKVTDVTFGDQSMKRVDYDADTPSTYLYVRGEDLYEIWTSDPKIVAAAVGASPPPDGSAAPGPSGSPGASPAPVASGSATP